MGEHLMNLNVNYVQEYDQKDQEHILAVRFEREEDSRSFRRFVEKRDVDKNQKNNSQITMTTSPSRKNTNFSSNSAHQINHYNPRHVTRSTSNIAHNNGYGGGYSQTN